MILNFLTIYYYRTKTLILLNHFHLERTFYVLVIAGKREELVC